MFKKLWNLIFGESQVEPNFTMFDCIRHDGYTYIPEEKWDKNLDYIIDLLIDPHSNYSITIDWLEHDELMFPHGNLTGSELLSLIKGPKEKLIVYPQDFMVCLGVLDIDHKWYLRLHFDCEDNEGYIHVCLPTGSPYVHSLSKVLPHSLLIESFIKEYAIKYPEKTK